MDFNQVDAAHKKYRKIFFSGAITLVIAILIMVFGDMLSVNKFLNSLLIILLFAAIVVIVFMLYFGRKASKDYKKKYKAYFVDKALRSIFTELMYDHEAGLSRAVLDETQFIYTGDRYSSNDLTTGKYKDVFFVQADVLIQQRYNDGKGNANYSTLFKGRFMLYEFPKKFNFRLEVVEKGFNVSKIPGKDKKTGRKFEKIEVESGEFNEIFKTYAEDGFEAFYLLDPAFINNMLSLAEQYKGKILLGFIDNKLLVGLKDGKDAFEPPNVFQHLDEKAEIDKIAKEIHLITNFVDTLKLNQKLFKK